MKPMQWSTVDKSTWGSGPWQDEPDKMQWTDEATGLPCLVVRNRFGALCGYVGVPVGHPMHGLGCDDGVGPNLECHGGLTFAGPCADASENLAQTICHVPEAGEADAVWWLGFDCNHGGDFAPKMASEFKFAFPSQEYRTLSYVQDECQHLARQLIALAA